MTSQFFDVPPRSRVCKWLIAGAVLAVLAYAAGEIRDAMRSPQERAMRHYYLGKQYHHQGHPKKAYRELERAVTYWPEYAKAHLMLGVAQTDCGEYDKALASYQKALALGLDAQNVPVAQHNIGLEYIRKGDFATAQKHFTEAYRLEPSADNKAHLDDLKAGRGEAARHKIEHWGSVAGHMHGQIAFAMTAGPIALGVVALGGFIGGFRFRQRQRYAQGGVSSFSPTDVLVGCLFSAAGTGLAGVIMLLALNFWLRAG